MPSPSSPMTTVVVPNAMNPAVNSMNGEAFPPPPSRKRTGGVSRTGSPTPARRSPRKAPAIPHPGIIVDPAWIRYRR